MILLLYFPVSFFMFLPFFFLTFDDESTSMVYEGGVCENPARTAGDFRL